MKQTKPNTWEHAIKDSITGVVLGNHLNIWIPPAPCLQSYQKELALMSKSKQRGDAVLI